MICIKSSHLSGLFGAPATFQHFMDWVQHPHSAYAGAYLGDLIIISHLTFTFLFLFLFFGGGCSCTVSKLFISYGFLKGHATVIIMSYNENKAILFYSILFIHCDTWVEHMQWVAVVLESLRQMGLTVNLKTSAVGWREVQHLGHQLEKIQCVADSVRYYLLVCPFTLWAVGSPVIHHTNYTLPISVAAGPGGESCVVWVSCRGQLKSCM